MADKDKKDAKKAGKPDPKADKGAKIGLNFNISVTHAKRDNFEVFWATEKADKTTEKPYIWGTVELK